MINSANSESGGPQQLQPYGALWVQQTLAKRWASTIENNPYHRAMLIKKTDLLVRNAFKNKKITKQLEELSLSKPKESLVRHYYRTELAGAVERCIRLSTDMFPVRYFKSQATKRVLTARKNQKDQLQAENLLSKMKKQDIQSSRKTRVLNGDIASSKIATFSESPYAAYDMDDALDSSGVYKCRLSFYESSWSFLDKKPQAQVSFPPWLRYCEFSTIPADYRLFKPMISSTIITLGAELGIKIPRTLKFTDYSRSSCEEQVRESPSPERVLNARIQQCSSRLSSSGSAPSRSSYSSSSDSSNKIFKQQNKKASPQKLEYQPEQSSNKWVAKIFGKGGSPPRLVALNTSNQPESHGHSGSVTQRQKRPAANPAQEAPLNKGQNGSSPIFKRLSSQLEVCSGSRIY